MTFYNPQQSVANCVENISLQVDKLYIFDNSGFFNSDLVSSFSNVVYYCEKENVGISKAFNTVFKEMQLTVKDDDFVFFFDQDTLIPHYHVEKMVNCYKTLESIGENIGCLGPAYTNGNEDKRIQLHHFRKKKMDGCYEVSNIITSSMLSRYRVLKSIGFWNERFFLDYADFELCWRMKLYGYKVYVSTCSIIKHMVGDGKGRAGSWGSEMPERDYYQVREGLKLLHCKYTPSRMKIRLFLLVYIRTIAYALFWNDRKQRIDYIKKGFGDYYTNA